MGPLYPVSTLYSRLWENQNRLPDGRRFWHERYLRLVVRRFAAFFAGRFAAAFFAGRLTAFFAGRFAAAFFAGRLAAFFFAAIDLKVKCDHD